MSKFFILGLNNFKIFHQQDMEAAGIEPASEDNQQIVSTCLSSSSSRSAATEEADRKGTSPV